MTPAAQPVGNQPLGIENAFAKLTLSLRITGIRNDGYHLLESEMVTLDLADRLVFFEGDSLNGDGLNIVQDSATGGFGVPTGSDNIVLKALAATGRNAAVTLEKHIPSGGGLGGASADAAAVLRWAQCRDLDVAESLGADVPFCLRGGHAIVRGVGEQVEHLDFMRRVFTLVTPDFGVSTPDVYRVWDELGGPAANGSNDLEPAALIVEPRMAVLRESIRRATGIVPALAGSGSTWFIEGNFSGIELEALSSSEQLPQYKIRVVRTVPGINNP